MNKLKSKVWKKTSIVTNAHYDAFEISVTKSVKIFLLLVIGHASSKVWVLNDLD